MRAIKFSVFISVLLFILIGCSNKVTGDEETAEQFVITQGYMITSYIGEIHRYTLDKSKLIGGTESIPYKQAWGVQTVAPDSYFGKEITIYGFTVSNHPLEKIYKAESNVYIMLSDGKAIGGYAFPNVDGMAGGYYSLEGKTLEEITGLSFNEWSDNWKKKYVGH